VSTAVGRHLIADFWGAHGLSDQALLEEAIVQAVQRAGAILLNLQLHHFGENNGVTGVALLSESHLSIHTWPEQGFAALDAFMCGGADPYAAIEHLRDRMQPTRSCVRLVCRGEPGFGEFSGNL
jgi:S-adenosylmethionine decarboxylase